MNGESPAAVAPTPRVVRPQENRRAWVLSLIVLAAIAALGLVTLFVLVRLLPSDVEIQIKRAGVTVTIVGGLGFFIVLFKVFFNSFTKLVGLFVTLMAVLIAVDIVGVGVGPAGIDPVATAVVEVVPVPADSTIDFRNGDTVSSRQYAAWQARMLEAVVSRQYADFDSRMLGVERRIEQLALETREATERAESRYARFSAPRTAPPEVLMAVDDDEISQRLDRILEELARLRAQVARLESAVDALEGGAALE